MRTERVFDQPTPSREEIQAAIRRGHYERSQALRRMLAALFSPRTVNAREREHAPGLGSAACR
jgi:hypothetical protein